MNIDEVLMSLFLVGIDQKKYGPWLEQMRETDDVDAKFTPHERSEPLSLLQILSVEAYMFPEDNQKYLKFADILYQGGADVSLAIHEYIDEYKLYAIADVMTDKGYVFDDPEILKKEINCS